MLICLGRYAFHYKLPPVAGLLQGNLCALLLLPSGSLRSAHPCTAPVAAPVLDRPVPARQGMLLHQQTTRPQLLNF